MVAYSLLFIEDLSEAAFSRLAFRGDWASIGAVTTPKKLTAKQLSNPGAKNTNDIPTTILNLKHHQVGLERTYSASSTERSINRATAPRRLQHSVRTQLARNKSRKT